MSVLESKAMEDARARALQVAAEAAEIAAEEDAQSLRRETQSKTQQALKREKKCRQKQVSNYVRIYPFKVPGDRIWRFWD
ncbi:hypothetical protein E6O75_ATG05477 [Venturia nashicola]|uniref:Uncharacterized protein n=1 Tax=Venturia nashicola TaxID=86259 RepID=A0A4Z1NX45_9PEZI|nr:hypothetical protein E6O75_ATG05477 [Venturia nashicola]